MVYRTYNHYVLYDFVVTCMEICKQCQLEKENKCKDGLVAPSLSLILFLCPLEADLQNTAFPRVTNCQLDKFYTTPRFASSYIL